MTATIAPSGRLHRGRTTWLMYGALGLLNYMISGVGPALPLLGGLVIACGTNAACTLGGAIATPWVEVPLWVMGHRRVPPPARRCPPASGGRFTSRATPGRHAAGADGMTPCRGWVTLRRDHPGEVALQRREEEPAGGFVCRGPATVVRIGGDLRLRVGGWRLLRRTHRLRVYRRQLCGRDRDDRL
jgi:hypothetical protein